MLKRRRSLGRATGPVRPRSCGPPAPLVRRRCLSSVPDAKPARDRFSIVGSSREGRAVYLDSQAMMPLDLRVLDAMLPYMTQMYGHPHSRTHTYGWESADVVEESRAKVALLIGADAKEIISTSGATESNNMAIKSSQTRHPAYRGDRQALPLQGRLLQHRWRAGGGQDPGGRQHAQHRPDVALSARAVRPLPLTNCTRILACAIWRPRSLLGRSTPVSNHSCVCLLVHTNRFLGCG